MNIKEFKFLPSKVFTIRLLLKMAAPFASKQNLKKIPVEKFNF